MCHGIISIGLVGLCSLVSGFVSQHYVRHAKATSGHFNIANLLISYLLLSVFRGPLLIVLLGVTHRYVTCLNVSTVPLDSVVTLVVLVSVVGGTGGVECSGSIA